MTEVPEPLAAGGSLSADPREIPRRQRARGSPGRYDGEISFAGDQETVTVQQLGWAAAHVTQSG